MLKADMTHEAPEIEEKLIEFGNTATAIPYYAVFRPGKEPHHFEGNFTLSGSKDFLSTAGLLPAESAVKASNTKVATSKVQPIAGASN